MFACAYYKYSYYDMQLLQNYEILQKKQTTQKYLLTCWRN